MGVLFFCREDHTHISSLLTAQHWTPTWWWSMLKIQKWFLWEGITTDYCIYSTVQFLQSEGLHRKWLERFLSKRESQWVQCSYMGKLAGYCKFRILNPCLHVWREPSWVPTTVHSHLKGGSWCDPDRARACGRVVRFVIRLPRLAPGEESTHQNICINCCCGK